MFKETILLYFQEEKLPSGLTQFYFLKKRISVPRELEDSLTGKRLEQVSHISPLKYALEVTLFLSALILFWYVHKNSARIVSNELIPDPVIAAFQYFKKNVEGNILGPVCRYEST